MYALEGALHAWSLQGSTSKKIYPHTHYFFAVDKFVTTQNSDFENIAALNFLQMSMYESYSARVLIDT